jgi:myo-inositol-1(or 4)-monophosphatase
LEFALNLCDETRRIVLSHYETGIAVDWKADASPVTRADKETEEFVRNRLIQEAPGDGIIGEEFGSEGNSTRQWVIDPIDGTKSFIHGVPLFGTLLALLVDGEAKVGIIDMPALGKRIYASEGGGAFLDGVPCRVSSINSIEQSLLLDGCTTTVENYGLGDPWKKLRQRARIHRGWGDCYGHFLVACGRAEAMMDPVVEIWDVAPLGVILPEAGGQFTNLQGTRDLRVRSGLSSNGHLHAEILQSLKINQA